MKTKLIKAYSTAWRWPEVYSEAPSIVWASRAIAIVLPLVIIVLTFTSGVPLFGWTTTAIIAGLIGIALIITTVRMFYTEYEDIEDFEVREKRIKEFFHGFPAHTSVPLIEYEPGEWVAYGHVPPHEFIEAIQTVVLHVTGAEVIADRFAFLEGSVGHLYACFKNPEEAHWSDGLNLCKPSEAESFPITRVEL